MNHRIIKSLRLEKTSKVIKSNRHLNTTMPTKPCLEEQAGHIAAASLFGWTSSVG